MKLAKIAFACVAAVSISAVAEDFSNTVAILPVAKALNAMPLTVNFTDANGNALPAEKVVKTANLPTGSYLYVYNNGVYIKYALKSDKSGWDLVQNKTYTVGANGALTEGDGVTSANLPVARGTAVFLETPANESVTFYVAGTPGSGTVTTVSAGANLIGAPKAADFDLNGSEAVFSSIAESTFTTSGNKIKSKGDMIQVPTSDSGLSTTYYYKQGTGWVKSAVINGTNTYSASGCVIPAGQGFWYIRKAGQADMTITW